MINNQQENNKNNSYSEFMISRSPKSNYEALTALEKKASEMFKKDGIYYELFRLAVNTSWEGFENISKIVSLSSSDEDVWITIMSYKDKKHRDEFVEKMANDKECQQGYEEWVKLLSPNSKIITGEFDRLLQS
ncbi:DUF1428 family protein [Candidatus Nitrosocosmicus franklandus]|uniref:NIPSNAP domain-containing protein n=1 Tax=Candidatus Nitrosocosmicus franklandianus TaxID=1798806 RepID=A0A484I9S9_9ARCH|nr:DUF1428 family protein [Candidatus Nitrosocosmicus franklandus]VFJ13572.1 conserved protein of unknown function [Candidatus Nitrosocosmicus franklandus]